MSIRDFIPAWSVARQLTGKDRLGLGKAAQSSLQANLVPRTAQADKVAKSICPYCGVGCGQRVFVKDGEVTQIEGDPDSPISRGRLCPKGAASSSSFKALCASTRSGTGVPTGPSGKSSA